LKKPFRKEKKETIVIVNAEKQFKRLLSKKKHWKFALREFKNQFKPVNYRPVL
jgi:hypothetical protein